MRWSRDECSAAGAPWLFTTCREHVRETLHVPDAGSTGRLACLIRTKIAGQGLPCFITLYSPHVQLKLGLAAVLLYWSSVKLLWLVCEFLDFCHTHNSFCPLVFLISLFVGQLWCMDFLLTLVWVIDYVALYNICNQISLITILWDYGHWAMARSRMFGYYSCA